MASRYVALDDQTAHCLGVAFAPIGGSVSDSCRGSIPFFDDRLLRFEGRAPKTRVLDLQGRVELEDPVGRTGAPDHLLGSVLLQAELMKQAGLE
jgi:hypothetical protein